MSRIPSFTEFFKGLWGEDKEPFPWQTMLAEDVMTRDWPSAIDLPTASGKTACLDIAIYSLAAQFDKPQGERTAARRIWFVVDRRIVVDEAYERAGKIATKLADENAPPAIRAVAERLVKIRGLPSSERPIAVGRLRGGVLRDDGWARIPSQPAIITSTVDQLGSRLLFRSYGSSPLGAPIYAALAGNDSLILLDEAHCAVPFLQTLRAIKGFRSRKWSEVANQTPFHVTVLSATPPGEDDGRKLNVFPTEGERDRALANETLQLRLRASKKAILKKVRDEKALVDGLANAAAEFARDSKHRIGVMVNRVGRAKEVAAILRETLKQTSSVGGHPAFDVELLTGRIRPVERDILVGDRLSPLLHSRVVQPPARPLIVIATQCLEVGADFSFDALVAECASLDALRQRFGRLDRLGTYGESPAMILTADSLLKDTDAIYGGALKNTWEFLLGVAAIENVGKQEQRTVDFGVNALTPLVPTRDKLRSLLAPSPDAPILLPAHIDLLCQTSPQPHPDPEIGFFLHGKSRQVADIRVVWRCDLNALPPSQWPEVVSLCRPVSGEMLAVPLYRFRQWLRDHASADDGGDVEGAGIETNGEQPIAFSMSFLIWRGRERSEVLSDPEKILAGSVVVMPVPDTLAEADALGQTLREGVGPHRMDLWERAWESAGRPPALRLNRTCLAPWLGVCQPLRDLVELVHPDDSDQPAEWEVQQVRDALAAVRDWRPDETSSSLPNWLHDLLNKVSDFRLRDIGEHPAGGVILRARPALTSVEEPDFFADEDDQPSEAPEEVKLASHSEDVAKCAALLAHACLGEDVAPLVKRAAQWHDAGKFDARFQIILRGGQSTGNGEPLAKSPDKPRAREQAKAASEAANLPDGFRHEMLSLQLAERFGVSGLTPDDRELLLHLIAAHHGHARPFAPVCEDREPSALDGQVDETKIHVTAAERKNFTVPHFLDSGVTDRFWKLNRRYGWWGLAYREAILRLADWYASAHPQSNSCPAEKVL